MVAAVEGAGHPAVHRTFLKADGSGKAGLDGGDKLMLGSTKGGAVRLSPFSGRLIVGEGVESTASALLLRGNLTDGAWAALSTSGMAGLRLPEPPGELVVARDHDAAGRAAAYDLADRACREGWAVSIISPPPGGDFNDQLDNEVAA
jgi:hypothetical protein